MEFKFVAAGFPSPAENYLDRQLDLNEFLINNKLATFFLKVKGNSMLGQHICPGDILLVDRSITPRHNHIVVAVVAGEFCVKRLSTMNNQLRLCSGNNQFPDLIFDNEESLEIWGVVTAAIHQFIEGAKSNV